MICVILLPCKEAKCSSSITCWKNEEKNSTYVYVKYRFDECKNPIDVISFVYEKNVANQHFELFRKNNGNFLLLIVFL